jgi:hypothetical protein
LIKFVEYIFRSLRHGCVMRSFSMRYVFVMRLFFDVDSEPLNNVPNSGKASLFKQRRYCMNDLEFGWYHFIFKWYSCQLNIYIRYCTSFPFARECMGLKKLCNRCCGHDLLTLYLFSTILAKRFLLNIRFLRSYYLPILVHGRSMQTKQCR